MAKEIILSATICWVVFYSSVALFGPEWVVGFILRSRVWSWYFHAFCNKTPDKLLQPKTKMNFRIQGVAGFACAAVLIYGLLFGS